MTIPAGTLVPRDARDFGNYELLAKVATGGMAEIFLARTNAVHNSTHWLVVKRILPHLAEDEHFVTMFRDEANLASMLVHANVCRVFTLGHVNHTWFIAMEYLHGVPLSRMLSKLAKRGKLVDARIVAGMILQACDGLHHAHEARDDDGHMLGVVHRDVSPPNMMLVASGLVKLLDFGIAKARGANSRTRTGTVKGKNAYMSPEQILGKPLDRRSDVFALGAVLYELLSVKRLFHRDSDFLTFKAITEEALPDRRTRRTDLPEGLHAVVAKALARDPNNEHSDQQREHERRFRERGRIHQAGATHAAAAEQRAHAEQAAATGAAAGDRDSAGAERADGHVDHSRQLRKPKPRGNTDLVHRRHCQHVDGRARPAARRRAGSDQRATQGCRTDDTRGGTRRSRHASDRHASHYLAGRHTAAAASTAVDAQCCGATFVCRCHAAGDADSAGQRRGAQEAIDLIDDARPGCIAQL